MIAWKDEDAVVPAKVWLPNKTDIEPGCLTQIQNVTKLPFAFHHYAQMPDGHQGYGIPIGGVLATVGYVSPNGVGVDINCGVIAKQTIITKDEFMAQRENVMNAVQRNIPAGEGRFNKEAKDTPEFSQFRFEDAPSLEPFHYCNIEKARHQLGTLGGGNHFVEFAVDENGLIWVMIHSGSRNLGYQVAQHYNQLARDLNKRYFSIVPDSHELAFLALDTQEGQDYMLAMEFCLDFAACNREVMLTEVEKALFRHFPQYNNYTYQPIHTFHNYAALEHHFGKNVVVHRKGAVRARAGEFVVIPGSMETASYIGRGLGNPESFNSCSHGAGRTMGRKQAMREITAESVILGLREKDILLRKSKRDDVAEECGKAYKDIDEVMENQKDLVEIVRKLTPVAVLKG